jgi:hypothetical protein
MTPGGRLLDFAFMCLTAMAIWAVAWLVWPFFELVAPVAALVAFLLAVNIVDSVRFAIRNRRRFAVAGKTAQAPSPAKRRATAA